MRDQIKILQQLSHLDSTIQNLQGRIRTLEMDLKRTAAEETLVTESFEREKGIFENAASLRRERTLEIAGLADRKDKLQKNLNAVKSNDEFQALLREIATIDHQVSEFETEILELMEEEEVGKKNLIRLEADVAKKRKGTAATKENLVSETTRLGEQIAMFGAEREELVSGLKGSLKSKYIRHKFLLRCGGEIKLFTAKAVGGYW